MPAEIHLFPLPVRQLRRAAARPATGATAAIDAPEAAPVEAALKETGWKLTDILVTHHHADHTDGIAALKQKYSCRVVAPAGEAAKIPAVDETVREGDKVNVGNLAANVIETPGHTLGHIAYWFHGDKLAFVGDTLFSIGCGRVIEGTPEQMWASLKKLRDLPDDTRNLLRPRIHAAEHQVRAAPSSRTTAALARARGAGETADRRKASRRSRRPSARRSSANPFLRADRADVAANVGMARQAGSRRFRGGPRAEEQVLSRALTPTAAEMIAKLALKPHPEGGHYRETFRDTHLIGGRAGIDRDPVPAGARRALALAPHRRRRGLALLRRRAAQARDRRRRRRKRSSGSAPTFMPTSAAGDRAGARLAGGGIARRLDAGRLHRRAGLHFRDVRAGGEGLVAALIYFVLPDAAMRPPPEMSSAASTRLAVAGDSRPAPETPSTAPAPRRSATPSRRMSPRLTPMSQT